MSYRSWSSLLCSSILAFCLVGTSKRLLADTIAVLGDSISTGGAAHENLRFDIDWLEKIFRDEVELKPGPAFYQLLQQAGEQIETPAQSPRRLPLSRREFDNPFTYASDAAMLTVGKKYLDTEEYSWIYLLARLRKISPHEILIAARDGEKAQHATNQIDRVLEATKDRNVRHLFVFFTGNDLCAPRAEFATEAKEFAKDIEKAIRYYMRNAKTDKFPSHIWLLDPLSILQLVSSSDILSRKTMAYGQELSCRDLQSGRFRLPESNTKPEALAERYVFNLLFGQGPKSYCPSLFSVHEPKGSEVQLQLSQRLLAYRQELGKLAERLKDAHPSFRIHSLKDTSQLIFQPEDIAQDCFHLSLNGQWRLAQLIDQAMKQALP